MSHPNYPQKDGRSGPSSQPSKLPMSGVPYGHLPAFLPGSASLVEQLDRRMMIVLRDGRHLVGILRSFDQFSNMVMEETSERRILHVKKGENTICYYTDIELGLYLIRGDSMVLMGEVSESQNAATADMDQDEKVNDDENSEGLTSNANDVLKHMKRLTLEQFEEMKEKAQQDNDVLDDLIWEFDMDLVV